MSQQLLSLPEEFSASAFKTQIPCDIGKQGLQGPLNIRAGCVQSELCRVEGVLQSAPKLKHMDYGTGHLGLMGEGGGQCGFETQNGYVTKQNPGCCRRSALVLTRLIPNLGQPRGTNRVLLPKMFFILLMLTAAPEPNVASVHQSYPIV